MLLSTGCSQGNHAAGGDSSAVQDATTQSTGTSDHGGTILGSPSSLESMPRGNGDSYSGLTTPPPPSGTTGSAGNPNDPVPGFYSQDKSYTCHTTAGATIASYRNLILVWQTGIYSLGDHCSHSQSTLPAGSLETSSYNPALVGYGAGIYEYKTDYPPSGTAAEVDVIAWCRTTGAGTQLGTDIFVKRTAAGAMTAALVSENSAHAVRTVAPFLVTLQTVGGARVFDAPAGDFAVSIRLDLAAVGGKYPGRAEGMVDGKQIALELSCRVLP